jgi:predicted phosphodiesterase
MQIAVLSDIHGNLEAFLAVIAAIDTRKPDRVICLGDLIGYGPDPDEVVSLVRQKGYYCIQGNHEAALQSETIRNWHNFQARENSIETEKLLSASNRDYCCNLKKNLVLDNTLFVHGFPPSSLLRYVSAASEKDLQMYLSTADTDLCFVGHTHELQIISWDNVHLRKETLQQDGYTLSHDCRYIINAGSVGQPRDGTNSAKFMLWDTQTYSLEVICVDYDYRATQQKIRKRGFPEAYGLRLG